MSDLKTGMNYSDTIYGIVVRINDILVEVVNSDSANIPGWVARDIDALEAFVLDLEVFVTWASGAPPIDSRRTHPLERPLPKPTYTNDGQTILIDEKTTMENHAGQDVLMLFLRLSGELQYSNSARLPNGLLVYDQQKIAVYIAKGRKFITEYIRTYTKADFPETSPDQPMTDTSE